MKVSMEVSKSKRFFWLYGALLVYSVSTICAKLASGQEKIGKAVLFIGLEIVFLGIYAFIWQQVLKKFSLVTAISSKGIIVILNLIWSVLIFQETVTLCNILGAFIIIFGIWTVSSDD